MLTTGDGRMNTWIVRPKQAIDYGVDSRKVCVGFDEVMNRVVDVMLTRRVGVVDSVVTPSVNSGKSQSAKPTRGRREEEGQAYGKKQNVTPPRNEDELVPSMVVRVLVV